MLKQRKPILNALHPGEYVRTRIVEPLGLSVKDAAAALGVHRVALSRLMNAQAALSSEMAIRLEKAFGASMEKLMRMQNEFDIALAYQRENEIKVTRYVARPTNTDQTTSIP